MMFSHEAVHGRAEAGGPGVRGGDGSDGMMFRCQVAQVRVHRHLRGGDGSDGMMFSHEAVHGRVDRPFEAAMAPPA